MLINYHSRGIPRSSNPVLGPSHGARFLGPEREPRKRRVSTTYQRYTIRCLEERRSLVAKRNGRARVVDGYLVFGPVGFGARPSASTPPSVGLFDVSRFGRSDDDRPVPREHAHTIRPSDGCSPGGQRFCSCKPFTRPTT